MTTLVTKREYFNALEAQRRRQARCPHKEIRDVGGRWVCCSCSAEFALGTKSSDSVLQRQRDEAQAALRLALDRIAHLSEAVETRDVIAAAKGLLMARGLTSGEAWTALQERSNRLNIKVRVLAEQLVAAHDAGIDPKSDEPALPAEKGDNP